jgi:transposase
MLSTAPCFGCEARDRRIVGLATDVYNLRVQLDELRREQGRQAGRFRRRKTKKKRKKPGRPKGHEAALRPAPTREQVDRVIDVPCAECPDCHVPLVDPGQVVQYQTDLPPIVPIVTQFNIETGFCPCCRQRHQGRHPEQTSDAVGAAGNTFGPVVLTMAAELKHRLGVPYRKICDFLKTYCGLHTCPATFVRAEQRLAELARPSYELLLDALRRAHVVHADETGWRISNVNAWLWVFSSKDVTIYAIRRSRGHDVPEEVLGADFDGFLIVDGLQAYDVLDYAKGRCNAHILRRAKDLIDIVPPREIERLESLIRLLQKAMDLAQRRNEFTPENYTRRVHRIEERLDDWLEANNRRRTLSPDLERLDMHLRKHRGEWLVFLHDPEVPPTNNHAEQMLRPAVITRKVGGCNKTLLGAMVHGILSSIMVTCKRQGKRFLDLARELWRAPQPQAIELTGLSTA